MELWNLRSELNAAELEVSRLEFSAARCADLDLARHFRVLSKAHTEDTILPLLQAAEELELTRAAIFGLLCASSNKTKIVSYSAVSQCGGGGGGGGEGAAAAAAEGEASSGLLQIGMHTCQLLIISQKLQRLNLRYRVARFAFGSKCRRARSFSSGILCCKMR